MLKKSKFRFFNLINLYMKIKGLSDEQLFQVQEMIKCKEDITYFIEHYCKIPTPGGSEVMKLYVPQRTAINTMVNDHYIVTLKSRQVGMSCLSQCYCTWCNTFFENVVTGILSRSGDEASDFNRKVTNMIDELPDWMRPKYVKRTEQTFILENGCQSFSTGVNPANPSSVFRGKSLSNLIIDEAAFIAGITDAFTSCGPSLVKAQKSARECGNPYATFIISTPNKTSGMGKFYYDMWRKANAGDSIYKPVILKWDMIDEFKNDPDWYKTQCEILNNVEWRIAQELNCEFIQGGNSFLPADTIKALQANEKPPIREINLNGAILRQWKDINPKRSYLIGVDTASAYGSDSSTIEVIDYIDCEQVAEVQFKGRVDEFCPIITKVATMYPNSIIIPEANSFGKQVCEYLTKRGGEFTLYQSKVIPKDVKNRGKWKYRYGIYTNPLNRPLIVDALYTAVTENPECIKSRQAILELIGLVSDGNGKIAADEGEHDDLSMALAFAFYVRQYDPPTGLKAIFGDKRSIEDSLEIISWNDTSNGDFDVSALVKNPYKSEEELEKHDIQETLTKQVQDFVSKNFHNLINNYYNQIQGTSNIDILKLIGNNSFSRNTF